jgi:hypothetical protein
MPDFYSWFIILPIVIFKFGCRWFWGVLRTSSWCLMLVILIRSPSIPSLLLWCAAAMFSQWGFETGWKIFSCHSFGLLEGSIATLKYYPLEGFTVFRDLCPFSCHKLSVTYLRQLIFLIFVPIIYMPVSFVWHISFYFIFTYTVVELPNYFVLLDML